MKTIYKYRLVQGSFPLPKGAEILTIQMQNGAPYVWAKINTKAEIDYRVLVVIGTGQAIPDGFEYKYIDTYQDDEFVWHVFEILSQKQ